jgi:hypothetical protein
MITTVANADALEQLLHDLNEAGITPSVAFLDAQGIAGVAYGIDEGDTMGTAYLSDQGDDRYVSVEGEPSAESYISDFERPLDDLRGPIVVLHQPTDPEDGS